MKSKTILLFTVVTFVFISCSNEKSFKDKVENFVKDSVLISFNDPKSFEFVSQKVDTFKTKDFLQNKQDFLKYASNREDSLMQLKQIDSLKLLPQETVINYQITISYRAKNKMGALILDNMLLYYYQDQNKFEVIKLQDK